MYKVYFRFYSKVDFTQIRLVSSNVTTENLVELLPLVHIPINNFFFDHSEITICSRLKMFFTERNLKRYLRFVNMNSESDVCFMIDKILKS